jgi:hypothetical protein
MYAYICVCTHTNSAHTSTTHMCVDIIYTHIYVYICRYIYIYVVIYV